MNEIREKYKDDSNQANQQIITCTRSTESTRPQLPPHAAADAILFALYAVSGPRSDFGNPRLFWIKDLSIPDAVFHLPFTILFSGSPTSAVWLLPWASRCSAAEDDVTDPRQKSDGVDDARADDADVQQPAVGLNLYYFVFNLLAIGSRSGSTRDRRRTVRKVDPKKREADPCRLTKNSRR